MIRRSRSTIQYSAGIWRTTRSSDRRGALELLALAARPRSSSSSVTSSTEASKLGPRCVLDRRGRRSGPSAMLPSLRAPFDTGRRRRRRCGRYSLDQRARARRIDVDVAVEVRSRAARRRVVAEHRASAGLTYDERAVARVDRYIPIGERSNSRYSSGFGRQRHARQSTAAARLRSRRTRRRASARAGCGPEADSRSRRAPPRDRRASSTDRPASASPTSSGSSTGGIHAAILWVSPGEQRAHRDVREPAAEQAIERRRPAAAHDVAEHGDARLDRRRLGVGRARRAAARRPRPSGGRSGSRRPRP